MENVTDRVSNPFDLRPPCERFVPGYGDANAEFHVIGDHPGSGGGAETGVPFTDAAGKRLQGALAAAGLLEDVGDRPAVSNTYLSYLNMCVPESESTNGDEPAEPTAGDYEATERFFDAELRAIAAHVLLPVGERTTRHVIDNYTARSGKITVDMEALHGTEILGAGWLVYPIADPREWNDTHRATLVDALSNLRSTDFHREVDLGRFVGDGEPYFVR